jgi:hypothetical protein
MHSYRNSQYLFRESYRKSGCCRYFDPFTIRSPVKNKHRLHSRHPDSYLFNGTEGVNKILFTILSEENFDAKENNE